MPISLGYHSCDVSNDVASKLFAPIFSATKQTYLFCSQCSFQNTFSSLQYERKSINIFYRKINIKHII